MVRGQSRWTVHAACRPWRPLIEDAPRSHLPWFEPKRQSAVRAAPHGESLVAAPPGELPKEIRPSSGCAQRRGGRAGRSASPVCGDSHQSAPCAPEVCKGRHDGASRRSNAHHARSGTAAATAGSANGRSASTAPHAGPWHHCRGRARRASTWPPNCRSAEKRRDDGSRAEQPMPCAVARHERGPGVCDPFSVRARRAAECSRARPSRS